MVASPTALSTIALGESWTRCLTDAFSTSLRRRKMACRKKKAPGVVFCYWANHILFLAIIRLITVELYIQVFHGFWVKRVWCVPMDLLASLLILSGNAVGGEFDGVCLSVVVSLQTITQPRMMSASPSMVRTWTDPETVSHFFEGIYVRWGWRSALTY